MSKECPSSENHREAPQSHIRELSDRRVGFSDLFRSDAKAVAYNSGYSLQEDEIADATTIINTAAEARREREERETIPEISQADIRSARRQIRNRFRGAA